MRRDSNKPYNVTTKAFFVLNIAMSSFIDSDLVPCEDNVGVTNDLNAAHNYWRTHGAKNFKKTVFPSVSLS
jgi:hypothetical protein